MTTNPMLGLIVIVIVGVIVAGCSAPSGSVTPSPTTTQTPTAQRTTAPTTVITPSTTTSTVVPTITTTAPPGQEVTVNIVAKGFAFNTKTITVPAGAKVTINFDNQDDGVPHNVAFYETSAAQKSIFVGQRIVGAAKITYTFTAPATAGTYYFRCDVHPSMNGNFVVI